MSKLWNDKGALSKAIGALEANSTDEISHKLGEHQKVRNIYNNIVDPYHKHPFVATDLHMVSASLGQAISGKHLFAKNAYGSDQEFRDGDFSGLFGTNPVYLKAAEIAAERLGISNPHEIQSIAFHMSRALFDPGLKNSGRKHEIENLWNLVDEGEITSEQARKRMFEIAKGFNPMPWLKPGTTTVRSTYK